MRSKQTQPPVVFRAYVRPIKGCSEATQRDMIGDGAIYYTADERADWLRAIRPDEVAVVARLAVIPPPRSRGVRPTADLAATLADLLPRCLYVLEAGTGITSLAGKRWREAVMAAGRVVSQGRTMTSERGKRLAKLSHENREPGRYKLLTSDDMREWCARWAERWRDPRYSSAEAAFASMPAEVRNLLGTVSMARDVFGPRHPGKGFGRPPKRGKRKR